MTKPHAIVYSDPSTPENDDGALCWDHEQTVGHVKELLDKGIPRKKVKVYLVGPRSPLEHYLSK